MRLETIYLSFFIQGRGALRRRLAQSLRTGRAYRRPKTIRDPTGTFPAGQEAGVYDLLDQPERARDEYEAAKASLEKELQENPDAYRLHFRLGRALAGLGLRGR